MKTILFILFFPITLPIWLIKVMISAGINIGKFFMYAIGAVIILGLLFTLLSIFGYIIVVIALICILVATIKYFYEKKHPKHYDISQVNGMSDGHQFEHYVAEILEQNGYNNVQVTQASGDYGVDVIAFNGNNKYAIQCKLYSKSVGNNAVQEVVAGMSYYRCNVGVVITNNFFTNNAIALARANGIILWDRKLLTQLINNADKRYREKSTAYVRQNFASSTTATTAPAPAAPVQSVPPAPPVQSEYTTPSIVQNDDLDNNIATDECEVLDVDNCDVDSETYLSLDEITEKMTQTAITLIDTFNDFNIGVKIIDIEFKDGVFIYEFEPLAGTQISKITGLSQELKFYLGALKVEIVLSVGKPTFKVCVTKMIHPAQIQTNSTATNNTYYDEMLTPAIDCIIEAGMASTSLIQRRLKLGYVRSAALIDEIERLGIVGPSEGSKPRLVLISKDKWEEIKNNA